MPPWKFRNDMPSKLSHVYTLPPRIKCEVLRIERVILDKACWEAEQLLDDVWLTDDKV